jgi:hypothetical protein
VSRLARTGALLVDAVTSSGTSPATEMRVARRGPGLRSAQRSADRQEDRLRRLDLPLQGAGVRHVRLHDGRHTAGTLLLSENVHPRVVMALLATTRCARRWTSQPRHAGLGARGGEPDGRPAAWQVRAGTLQPRKPSTQGTTKKAVLRGVELRGLEPLTPTLPGRVDHVHSGSLRSRKPLHLRL